MKINIGGERYFVAEFDQNVCAFFNNSSRSSIEGQRFVFLIFSLPRYLYITCSKLLKISNKEINIDKCLEIDQINYSFRNKNYNLKLTDCREMKRVICKEKRN